MISFLFLVPSSMLSTVSALGAQNVGAGKPERAAATLKYAICIAGGFGLIIAIIIQFTAGNVVNLFTNDQAVVYAGAQYLKGYIWDCMFAGIHFSFSGYFVPVDGPGIPLFTILPPLPWCVSQECILPLRYSRKHYFQWDWQQRVVLLCRLCSVPGYSFFCRDRNDRRKVYRNTNIAV